MPTYKAPVSDTVFLLSDVFDYAKYANSPGFSDAPIDVIEAVLSEGAKFVEEVVQPLNRIGDIEGCTRHDDGSVTTPRVSSRLIRAWSRAAGSGLRAIPTIGGQGLPMFVGALFGEYECSANIAFSMYPGLTRGAVAAFTVAWRRRSEIALSAEDDHRRVDRHDVPDRTALRHRSRPYQDPCAPVKRTAPTPSPARRSSSRPASMI